MTRNPGWTAYYGTALAATVSTLALWRHYDRRDRLADEKAKARREWEEATAEERFIQNFVTGMQGHQRVIVIGEEEEMRRMAKVAWDHMKARQSGLVVHGAGSADSPINDRSVHEVIDDQEQQTQLAQCSGSSGLASTARTVTEGFTANDQVSVSYCTGCWTTQCPGCGDSLCAKMGAVADSIRAKRAADGATRVTEVDGENDVGTNPLTLKARGDHV